MTQTEITNPATVTADPSTKVNGRSTGREPDQTMKNHLEIGSITIDLPTRSCLNRGTEVRLTSSEFDLLWLLAQNAGRVVDRDQIYTTLRGSEYDGLERSIDLKIARIRKKLGENGRQPRRIKSIRSEGYLLTTA